MFGIYRGRRLALYIALAIIIATLVGYSTYSFSKSAGIIMTLIYTRLQLT